MNTDNRKHHNKITCLSAEAMGFENILVGTDLVLWGAIVTDKTGDRYWNPMGDNNDAFELAAKLQLDIVHEWYTVTARRVLTPDVNFERTIAGLSDPNRMETMRAAITEAAAIIMEKTHERNLQSA